MVDLPATAAWRHLEARVGFEVLFLRREPDGYRFDGSSTAVDDGEAWSNNYGLRLDTTWATRSARIVGRSAVGTREVLLEADGAGAWVIDGRPAAELAGCLDVDLEASAATNALPVQRLGLEVGEMANAPAAYVRALDLRVERLEQSYVRLPDDAQHSRYDYAARPSSSTEACSSTTGSASCSTIRASPSGRRRNSPSARPAAMPAAAL